MFNITQKGDKDRQQLKLSCACNYVKRKTVAQLLLYV